MTNDVFTIRVDFSDQGKRIDAYVADKFKSFSRSKIQKSILQKKLTVNGTTPVASYRVKTADEISFSVVPEAILDYSPQQLPLDIVYEDADILVINKPAGIVVHPAAGNAAGTVLNAVLGYTKSTNVTRAGIVHRLDKETSGLLVIAKDEKNLSYLQSEFKERNVIKKYLTLVWGTPKTREGLIDAPIGRSLRDRKKMAVTESGRSAQTIFKVLHEYKTADGQALTLLEIVPKTGRTHQIRVHLKFLGLPVVGDKTYGRKSKLDVSLGRQFLHAFYLEFTDHNGNRKEFQIGLPLELNKFLTQF